MNFPEQLGIPEYEFRLIFGRTRIEYDENKDESNIKKHKYSLESAAHFLERLMLPVPQPPFITSDPFEENGEVRHMHLSIDDSGNVVLFVTTMRDEETVRVISFREANAKERLLYYKHRDYRAS